MDAADPNLCLWHEPVGAGELRAEGELVAPRSAQAHVERDQAQSAQAHRGEEEHHDDADDGAVRHHGAPGLKHWSAQWTRHMCTQSFGLLPGSSGCPMPLITEA